MLDGYRQAEVSETSTKYLIHIVLNRSKDSKLLNSVSGLNFSHVKSNLGCPH